MCKRLHYSFRQHTILYCPHTFFLYPSHNNSGPVIKFILNLTIPPTMSKVWLLLFDNSGYYIFRASTGPPGCCNPRSLRGTYLPVRGPSLPSRGPSFPSWGPSLLSRGPSLPSRGPSLPSRGPSLPSQGPSLPSRGPSLPSWAPLSPVGAHLTKCVNLKFKNTP